jgi:nucleoside-diphosphate-sugar epimerase
MRILITGANGFIARHLIAAAAAQGDEVLALARSGAHIAGATQTYAWSLGQLAPPACVKDRQCAIHLAHDFAGTTGAQRTLDGTLALAAQLQAAGITRQLFFSSYSAGTQATSLYSRTKLALEQSLTGYRGMVIVRPGLVLGAGGLYGRIRHWAQRLPLVPLPDGGSGVVPVIKVEKLCRLTLQLARNAQAPGTANLFEPQLKSLRALVIEAAVEAGRHPRILPIPSGLLLAGLRLAATLKLPLPVNPDNLVGFLANQSAQHKSHLSPEAGDRT